MFTVVQINTKTKTLTKVKEVFTKEEAIEEVEYFNAAYAYTKQFEYAYNEIV